MPVAVGFRKKGFCCAIFFRGQRWVYFLQSIGLALANATVIESIFSIPGFGYLIVNHVLDRDTPMIHAEVFFLALAIALCNIAADLVQWAIGRKKGVA